MKRSFSIIIIMLLALPSLCNAQVTAPEKFGKALWVVRYSLLSRESIDKLIDISARAGFNTLFVQVCGRGDAYFPSNVYPPAENYRDAGLNGFDPLAYILDRAHAEDIQVHAWINTLLVWSAAEKPVDRVHVINSHPEWMMVDYKGVSMKDYGRKRIARERTEGVFLSLSEPSAREHVKNFVVDLVSRYPVDGVHFDYIRYPLRSMDLSPRMREGFKAVSGGVDPRELFTAKDRLISQRGQEAVDQLIASWRSYRASIITGFLKETRSAIDASRPGTSISAAVKPDIESAFEIFGQDWPRWVREGYVDRVLPMAYSKDRDTVYGQISAAAKAVGGGNVWAGLRAWDVPAKSIYERTRSMKGLNLGGICFFSYNGLESKPKILEQLGRELR